MESITEFESMRFNNSEFLAVDNNGNSEWIDIETICKFIAGNKISKTAFKCTPEILQINIFGRFHNADKEAYKTVRSKFERTNTVVNNTSTGVKETKNNTDKVEVKKKTTCAIKNPAVLAAIKAEKEAEDKQKKETTSACKVTKKTISKYYNDPRGNLYAYNKESKLFEIVDGFSEEECVHMLNNRVAIIFIVGKSLNEKDATKVARSIINKKSVAQEVKDIEQLESLDKPAQYGSFYEGLGSSDYDFDAKEYVGKH